MLQTITDIDDPRVAVFRNLPAHRDLVGETIIVESEHAVRRMLEAGVPAIAVLIVDKRVPHLAIPEGVDVFVCNQATLDRIVGFPMHRGAMALAPRPHADVEALAHVLKAKRLVVCASNVSDTANLGSIARNARALGAGGLLVDTRGGDIYARKAIRTSMGHVFALPVAVAELAPAIALLRERVPDLCVAAATLGTRAVDVGSFRTPERCMLIVGNEGDGISADTLALADAEVTIPMHDGTDSLNVAAASAVFLYALENGKRR